MNQIIVVIHVKKAHDGYVSTALDDAGMVLAEWYHPHKGESISRTKYSVFERLRTNLVMFKVEDK